MKIPTDKLVSELRSTPYTMLTLFALCAFALWGYSKFALAADVETIRTEVRHEISSVTVAVTANATSINKVLKLQYAEAIRGQHRQFCGSDDDAYRESVQVLIDSLQENYKALNKNVAYPLPGCR